MIGVKKIAHASYETPDLDQQVEYYTDILGLTLIAQGQGRGLSRLTIDHHSVVLRHGAHPRTACALGFQLGPDDDLDGFEKQTAAHGIKTERKKDPEPTIDGHGHLRGSEGHRSWRCSSGRSFAHQTFRRKGIVPHKLGHVAFHVTDVKQVTKFYCDVLGFRVSDWMGDFFSFLRCGPDHHTINLMETGQNRHFHTAFELRDWAPHADRLRLPQPQRLQAAVGPGPARHRPQSVRLSSLAERPDHRDCSPNSTR